MVGLHINKLSFTSLFLLLQLTARTVPHPAPDFPEQAAAAGKSRQAPNRINCSDCKQQLTNRIRQMQHLERMKQRIMSAIRNNGNHVPSNDATRPVPKVTEGRKVRGQQQSRGSEVQDRSDKPAANAASAGRTGSPQQKRTRGKPRDPQFSNATYPTTPTPLSSTRGKGRPVTSPGSTVTHHPRGRDRDKERKGSRAGLIETRGPNIVSFSRVVSSGKRKHVLQFTLKPTGHGEDLEVVKAHLWLLLTRSRPQDDDLKPKDLDLNNQANAGKQTLKAEDSAKRSRSKDHPSVEADENAEVVKETNSSSRVQNVHKNPNKKERQKRSASSSNSANETSEQILKSQRHKPPKNNDPEEDEDPDENDERFQAVLRILLLADNGTRTLMTYLRTNVKVTHWQKIRLPVSVIQKQLQSSQNTLTLLIRCRRCGEAVQMVLPKQKRSKSRRKERRKRRRKDRRKKKSSRREKKKRHHRRRKRRHGVRGRERGRRREGGRKENRRQFRPLPFLVINTRLRSNKKSA